VLLTHPNIADAAVIGVESRSEATELPRAYIVLDKTKGPIKDDYITFGKGVQKWMETKVARHKYLRGGVVVVDMIPKSAAGKILRRQLRERAKAELEADTHKAKL
jgi:4-coumarate--CoA ligase